MQISSSVIPKMRSVSIKFTGTGMKPNTRIQAYFENFRVTDYLTGVYTTGNTAVQANTITDFFVNKGNVYTDSAGTASGSFFYDASHFNFSTGEKLFRLSDSPTNGTDSETQAEAKFSTLGQLKTLQNQIISTRNGLLTSESVYDGRQTAVPPPAVVDTGGGGGGAGGGGGGDGGTAGSGTQPVAATKPPLTIIDVIYNVSAGRTPEQKGASYWFNQGTVGVVANGIQNISESAKTTIGTFLTSTGTTASATSNFTSVYAAVTAGGGTAADIAIIRDTLTAISSITTSAIQGGVNVETNNGLITQNIKDGQTAIEAATNAAGSLTLALLGGDKAPAGVLKDTITEVKANDKNGTDQISTVTPNISVPVASCYSKDPLAQTFIVSGSPGIMTGVDLFFYAKDASAPMYVELRTVVNGTPSQTVVPFSRKVVFPSEISTSDNGATATYLKFDGLVYLEPGEYAIVLLTSSLDYRVWISQIGESDIITGKKINSQPFIGVLFKSQNASSWEANQNQDLKFRLYRAVFTKNTPATIDFEVDVNDYQFADYITLGTNPLEFYPGSAVAKVYHPNNGFVSGSTVKLINLNNDTSNIYSLVNTSNIYGVNVVTVNNVEFTVSNVKPDSYTIIMPVSSNTTSIVRVGGASVLAYQDVQYDAIFPAISALKLSDTTFNISAKVTDKGYSLQSTFTALDGEEATELETTAVLPSAVNIVNNLSSARPLTIRLTLNNTNTGISPIVDMQQLSAVFIKNLINKPTYATENLNVDIVDVAKTSNVFFTNVSTTTGFISLDRPVDIANVASIVKGTTITVSNSSVNSSTFRVLDILDSGANILVYGAITTAAKGNVVTITNGRSFVAEEAATGGSALAKYITRQVDLVNPSTSINLRIDIAKPINADVKIYYKTKLVGESVSLDTKEYIELTGIVGGVIPDSLSGEFTEVAAVVDSLPQFTSVILKIVLLSDDSADTPKCKNLRAIMLA